MSYESGICDTCNAPMGVITHWETEQGTWASKCEACAAREKAAVVAPPPAFNDWKVKETFLPF